MKFSEMKYERVDMEALKSEVEDLMKRFDAAQSGEEQFSVKLELDKVLEHASSMMTIASVRNSINVADEFYKAEQDYYDQMRPVLSGIINEFNKKMIESPYRAYLEEKIGGVAFKTIELSMRSFDEKIIPLMQKENALVSEYEDLLAKAEIDMDGDVVNLSGLGKYLDSPDREVRKKAAKKRSEYFTEHLDDFDRLYDELVKNRTEQAKQLGYENYTQMGYDRMNRNSYDRDMVETFRDQVKKYWVPFCEKLHDRRRQTLGLDKLKYYDEGMYFKEGNPAPKGTPEEILQGGLSMYQELSPETGEFMSFMVENELFDVLGRKNKRTGGYMTYIPDYKAPFVFANFNGTSGDVDVITHECGHAFQGYVSRDYEISEWRDITMETAETHSMSMEFFTEPFMERFFGDRAQDYIDMHLMDSICFIPYGCMVDEFQHIVYDNPELTPAERRAEWRKLELVYKPHLDYEDGEYYNNGGFWQKQHHIYSYPLYYIDYCLAQTDALQYKVWMDKDYKAAWQSYLKLCKLSAKDYFVNMITECGLESPFEEGTIKKFVEALDK